MNGDKAQNGKGDGKFTPLLVALIGAVVGGSGTVGIFLGTPYGQQIARPDPFTGTQANALISDVALLKRDMISHKLTHPDRALDLRLTLLESNYKHITETLDRIEDKVDKE